MSISLNSLKKTSTNEPPIILLYGTAGMGKTSLALEFPDAVYLQIAPERPPAGIDFVSFGELHNFGDVADALGSLASEDHPFRTVVIDSMDALEVLVWRETCLHNQWKDIEAPGYGKGYLAADHVWRELINASNWLRANKGLTVIWLALAEATTHEEPGKAPYKRYSMRVHKRAEGLLTQSADAVLFINTKVELKETEAGFGKKNSHAEGGGTRWVFADGRPAFVAKNRMNMPDQVMMPKGKAYAAIQKFLPMMEEGASAAAQEQAA